MKLNIIDYYYKTQKLFYYIRLFEKWYNKIKMFLKNVLRIIKNVYIILGMKNIK